MAHNFKRPKSIDPEERRQDRDIAVMALQIKDQAMLDTLLEGAAPDMRAALVERLIPYLDFVPDTGSTDCPMCGRVRGTLIAHECLGVN